MMPVNGQKYKLPFSYLSDQTPTNDNIGGRLPENSGNSCLDSPSEKDSK